MFVCCAVLFGDVSDVSSFRWSSSSKEKHSFCPKCSPNLSVNNVSKSKLKDKRPLACTARVVFVNVGCRNKVKLLNCRPTICTSFCFCLRNGALNFLKRVTPLVAQSESRNTVTGSECRIVQVGECICCSTSVSLCFKSVRFLWFSLFGSVADNKGQISHLFFWTEQDDKPWHRTTLSQ